MSLATICLAASALIGQGAIEPQTENVQLAPGVIVRLASKEEAIAVLTQEDDFLRALSPFDMHVRMNTARDISPEEFRRHIASETLNWESAAGLKVLDVARRVQPLLKDYKLPWPKTILLVQTTGKEDADAPYTRGNAIIFPKRMNGREPAHLQKVFVHELFHILSRGNQEWRAAMYAIIGFKLCPDIKLPPDWRARKITNPDAPRIDTYLTIKDGPISYKAAPVLMSPVERYDPAVGGGLFKYADFRLMELEEGIGKMQPALSGGNLILHEPKNLADFHRQIGGNTAYIIHPDEVLADNFEHLIIGGAKLKNPEIVDKMYALCR